MKFSLAFLSTLTAFLAIVGNVAGMGPALATEHPMRSPTPGLASPTGAVPISVANAQQVQPLAHIGRGLIHDLVWSPDGQMLAVGTNVGIWLYATADLTT